MCVIKNRNSIFSYWLNMRNFFWKCCNTSHLSPIPGYEQHNYSRNRMTDDLISEGSLLRKRQSTRQKLLWNNRIAFWKLSWAHWRFRYRESLSWWLTSKTRTYFPKAHCLFGIIESSKGKLAFPEIAKLPNAFAVGRILRTHFVFFAIWILANERIFCDASCYLLRVRFSVMLFELSFM